MKFEKLFIGIQKLVRGTDEHIFEAIMYMIDDMMLCRDFIFGGDNTTDVGANDAVLDGYCSDPEYATPKLGPWDVPELSREQRRLERASEDDDGESLEEASKD